jgi:hypothetical protein
MKKEIVKQSSPARARRWWAVVGAIGTIVVGAGAFWLFSGGTDASAGSPRLVVDRELVDLGDLPFQAPARVAFSLTNNGSGTLRLAGVPRVKAVKGC